MPEIKLMLRQIELIHHAAYYQCKPQLEHLIATKIKDGNTKQLLLDFLLDHCCNAEVLNLRIISCFATKASRQLYKFIVPIFPYF